MRFMLIVLWMSPKDDASCLMKGILILKCFLLHHSLSDLVHWCSRYWKLQGILQHVRAYKFYLCNHCSREVASLLKQRACKVVIYIPLKNCKSAGDVWLLCGTTSRLFYLSTIISWLLNCKYLANKAKSQCQRTKKSSLV